MSEEAKTVFLKQLIKDAKVQIRNGFILGIVGLSFTLFGFVSFVFNLVSFSFTWLTLGVFGIALLAIAFYVMIRADMQAGKRAKELSNIAPAISKSELPQTAADDNNTNDSYFDEEYSDWKNPFEEDHE